MEKSEIEGLAFEIASGRVKKLNEAETLEHQRLTSFYDIHDEGEPQEIGRAVRYLELRGRLKRNPDDIGFAQFCGGDGMAMGGSW